MSENKLKKLEEILEKNGRMALAFSGGVDSTFLLGVARDVLGDDLLAVTASAAFFNERELEEAKAIAILFGVDHEITEVDLFDIENFTDNPPDRCYYCKKHLFSKIMEIAGGRGFDIVCDASNVDDAGDYRPGLKALVELGIISPLREAGLKKKEIRILSMERGYPNWNKPAAACCASRIPYNEEITVEKLVRVQKAESFMAGMGFKACRVRSHGDVARIEVPSDRIGLLVEPGLRGKIVDRLKLFGFRYITIDIEGYRMGSLNESLDI